MFNQPAEATVTANPDIELTTAICEHCDWRYLLPPERLPLRCPHCFQALLVALTDAQEAQPDQYRPELLIPFTVSAETVAGNIQNFARTIWFAPADLKPQQLQTRLQRLYLPMWLVDAEVEAAWQAETGFDYEAVTHQDSYSQNKGDWVSRQITETRIRWEPRLGRLKRRYDNIIAPALEEHRDLRRRLEAYDLTMAQPYQAQAMAEALVRLPNRAPADAWPETIPAFKARATAECRRACQADHIRDFRWQASYDRQNWTLLLLPVHATYYLDDEQTAQPILIHGQSGHLSGPRRASMKQAQKVAYVLAGVAVVIFALSLILALVSRFVSSLLLPAGIGLALGILIGLLALAPVGIVWQFNRRRQ